MILEDDKAILYETDEFPVTYDFDSDELICIGECIQCPLYINNYQQLVEPSISCRQLIRSLVCEHNRRI